MKKSIVLFALIFFTRVQIPAQVKIDTLRFFYDLNESAPDKHFQRMDSLFTAMSGKFIKVKILAYADFLNSPVYNQTLSQKRADGIKNYFLKKAAPMQIHSITAKGLGERFSKESGAKDGEPAMRRVDVIIEPFVIVDHHDDPQEVKIVEPDKKSHQLETLSKGESYAVEGLNFEPGRHFIVKSAVPILNHLLKVLQENPSIKIEIQGHICCLVGEDDGLDLDTNEKNLSEARAKAIYDFLVKNGIDPSRLTYKGFGRSKPKISPERTPADEQMNRRVEILITDK